jgi:hypothetical protein
MTQVQQVEALSRRIEERQIALHTADRYYAGSQPLAFLSPTQRKALGDRLTSVSANYVRLATDSLAERLTVDGFRPGSQSLAQVWADWQRSDMERGHRVAILEALITGQSFVTVWADDGLPVISVDSPREMATTRHPITHAVTSALKRWRAEDGTARAVLFLPDRISSWVGPDVPEGGALPTAGWRYSDTLPNPLGVVPVVALVNSGRLFDHDGTPESRDIWPLCDALAKLLADAMVASEAASLPRRWATGLAVKVGSDGLPKNPFSGAPGSVWQSENPETKFGGFPEPNLSGYDSLSEMILRQIGAVSGLPDHYMGFEGAEPSSAEQIRAAESGLVSRAYSHHVMFGPAFSRVAALCEAIRTGGRVRTDIETVWKSPESRTVAQAADAAAKVVASGLLSVEGAQREYLGLTPEQIDAERRATIRATLDRAPLTLPSREDAA